MYLQKHNSMKHTLFLMRLKYSIFIERQDNFLELTFDFHERIFLRHRNGVPYALK